MSDTAILTLRTMLANLDDAKKYQSLRDVMSTLPAPDLAAVFEDLPPEKLPVLFRLCPKDLAAEIFAELTPETQQNLIDGLTDKELKAVVDDLFVDDATDLVEEMPANVVKRILGQADPATRRMINELLKYPEDSAGGVMTTELMELRPDWTVAQAMDAIRKNGFDKETINNCYVTDRDRTLIGVVSLRALVLSKDPQNEIIRDMMDDNVVSVATTTDQEDVSQMFEKYGYLAIPVVDNEKRLVGIVTIDDAISIMQDEASEDIAKMNAIGPSDKPYFKQSMWDLYKSRAPWLLFLMISSTFSSMVIRGYEDALTAVTVLTAYIPMLTDAGGNAGSQSTSTIIRGLAVGDIERPAEDSVARVPHCHPLRRHAGAVQLCQADFPGRHQSSCGSGRLPDAGLHGHPVPADRRPAACCGRKVQDGPGRHGVAAYHHHRRYHDAAGLLQHCTGFAENLNFGHRVQNCRLYHTFGCGTIFLEKRPSPEGGRCPEGADEGQTSRSSPFIGQ